MVCRAGGGHRAEISHEDARAWLPCPAARGALSAGHPQRGAPSGRGTLRPGRPPRWAPLPKAAAWVPFHSALLREPAGWLPAHLLRRGAHEAAPRCGRADACLLHGSRTEEEGPRGPAPPSAGSAPRPLRSGPAGPGGLASVHVGPAGRLSGER